jgi:hypothetical protein
MLRKEAELMRLDAALITGEVAPWLWEKISAMADCSAKST